MKIQGLFLHGTIVAEILKLDDLVKSQQGRYPRESGGL